MSKLMKFLDRRAKGLAKQQTKKEKTDNKVKAPIEKKFKEKNPDLTDIEFWAISNQYRKESKNSEKNQVEILQNILEQYSPTKIKQFAKRYEELNR